ncbi:MAG: hypothetical protein Q8O25_17100 [Sulfurisoma sp.]|nr:hypothetical protein [Sulfurisoma sp.]
MTPTDAPPAPIEAFIARWSSAGGSERANYQLFITELCELLALLKPEPARADARDNAYVFERRVTFLHGDGSNSSGFIDCYRRACYILEAKQTKLAEASGRVFDDALLRARAQAENYARALPADEGRPPFLIVVDVGHVIELYAEFTRTGATYTPFPDPRSHRIRLADLRDEKIRARLRAVWLDPLGLDPATASAKVTRGIADQLAVIAKSLEVSHTPEVVAGFLTRCLFSMFAEDVGLIPRRAFTGLLESVANAPGQFQPMVATLWQEMDRGGFSVILRETLPRINGKLFKDTTALPLTRDQISLLQQAAKAEWTQVEPAIFGTLLTRSLDPAERHSLGAEYTPRPYVERLVLPTVIEPLRAEWENVKAAALLLANENKLDAARAQLHEFHHRLCRIRVLDPACGTANFLYVTLEHLKRLEGEVLDLLDQLGDTQGRLETEGLTVDPHQFLGLELNPRAAAIAELVLWIGYLQWHYRTRGNVRPPEPVLRDFKNIECRDAVLTDGQPAAWPEADYVVGNPPFIGKLNMRSALGDAYVDTLRAAYPEMPESADLVMFWWHKAAALVTAGKLKRFGLITTNSLTQTFNRRVLERHLGKLHLAYAIADHPWVDGGDGAAVRIAMTVGAPGPGEGKLLTVTDEHATGGEGLDVTLAEQRGAIHADLKVGANVAASLALQSNGGLSSNGFMLAGAGFIVTPEEAAHLETDAPIKPYRNGRDLTDRPRGVRLIDLSGYDAEEVRRRWPATYQRVLERVKPERDTNRDAGFRENWWLFGRQRPNMRSMLAGLPRYIATVETAKHRVIQFLDASIAPDHMLIAIALDDAYFLGVLSSRVHVVWALAQGGTLEDRPRYNKSRCFETFPFPAATPAQQARIRDLASQLDAHRKRVLAEHAELTLTGLYNVLQKVGAGETASLTAKERTTYDKGLVAVLKSFHDDVDAAVLDAYGWQDNPSDETILERLVALNAERTAEEVQGHIRWLRPEFQAPASTQTSMAGLGESGQRNVQPDEAPSPPAPPAPWPQTLPEQIAALANALSQNPQSEAELATRFTGKTKWKSRLPELLATLATLGRARRLDDGRWMG